MTTLCVRRLCRHAVSSRLHKLHGVTDLTYVVVHTHSVWGPTILLSLNEALKMHAMEASKVLKQKVSFIKRETFVDVLKSQANCRFGGQAAVLL